MIMNRIISLGVVCIVGFTALVAGQEVDYDATTNIQLGMQGLMQAGSDPALLAQLMKDMQVCVTLFTIRRYGFFLSWNRNDSYLFISSTFFPSL